MRFDIKYIQIVNSLKIQYDPVMTSLLRNSSTQWRVVVTTGKFLKTLKLLQLEYKSWDSPTAETESNTTNTEQNRHFHSVSSHNKRTQHTEDAVLSWIPIYSQSIHGLLLACTQSVARG